jgi:hypothetical protein
VALDVEFLQRPRTGRIEEVPHIPQSG